MKKIFLIMLCVLMIAAVPTVVFAEDAESVPDKTITEMVADYAKDHFEEITVIGTIIVSIFYERISKKKQNGLMGTLNNNAITIAENSTLSNRAMLDKAEAIGEILNKYDEKIEGVLAEFRKTAEENKKLEDMLMNAETFINDAKVAMLEVSNEFAELLLFANIPVAKKDEFFARHKKAVRPLEEAEGVINSD